MKKHLTPKSDCIPSEAAGETYKWQLSLEAKLLGLPGWGKAWGYVCQGAMAK